MKIDIPISEEEFERLLIQQGIEPTSENKARIKAGLADRWNSVIAEDIEVIQDGYLEDEYWKQGDKVIQ